MSFPDLYDYNSDDHFERVTPLGEIPEEYRMVANLPKGGTQIIDKRRAYNWNPTVGAMVECGSVAGDAHKLK